MAIMWLAVSCEERVVVLWALIVEDLGGWRGSNGCLYVYGGAHDDTQHQVACGLTKLGLKVTAAGKPFGLGIDVMTRVAMASHLGRCYNQ